MALTAAQTVTAMAAEPTITTPTNFPVTVELNFVGKTFIPADLLDALVQKYGSGKVSAETDTTARNHYRFKVIP